MDLSEGMVAVVRGTQDALCVTLMDGGRQYTLMPNAAVSKKTTSVQSTQKTEMVQHSTECQDASLVLCDSAAQAVDGRYASVYKMAHCNMAPTSPPQTLSEFPPQRADVRPGRGNFEVGGLGSGENFSPTRVCSFKGGMCWPDRGAVCSPRPSLEPDAFARSLRKYPHLSPERSTEIVERLINYTQIKNAKNVKNDSSNYDRERSSRSSNRVRYDPETVLDESLIQDRRAECPMRDRIPMESPMRDRISEESSITDRRIDASPIRFKINESQLRVEGSNRYGRSGESPIRDRRWDKTLTRDRRLDETLTRDRILDETLARDSRLEETLARDSLSPVRGRRFDEWEYRRFYGRSYDVRYARDATRRTRDSCKNFSTYPYSHPVCPTIKERFDHLPPLQKNRELRVKNSVNMETQAVVPKVSREMTTVPRVPPAVRNVAIPLSPTASNYDTNRENTLKTKHSSKIIQTTPALDLKCIKKSVQTCFSSADIQESMKLKSKRKSRSNEELRVSDDFDEETTQLIKELTNCPDSHIESVRNKLLRKLKRAHKIDRRDKVKIKIGRCLTDQMYSEFDLRNFTRQLSKELIAKIRRHNMFVSNNNPIIYRADIKKKQEENNVDEIIREWLNDIPFKKTDYLGRDIKKGQLFNTITCKIRTLIINKLKYNSDNTMKNDIIQIIKDIPIDVNGHNKRYYLNRLASDLIRKIKDMFTLGYRRRWRKEAPGQLMEPTENELKLFAREEIIEFTAKFSLRVCPETLKQIEIELTNILVDSMQILRLGNEEDVKEEILMMLADYVSITEHQAIYFANNIIYNLKDTFEQFNGIRKQRPQAFVVLQNSSNNTHGGNNNADSILGITEADLAYNLESYTNQVANEIREWSTNKKGFQNVDPAFKEVVIQDLAGDIVDRHKYLELNPTSNSEDDEIEHLKYQIFKWVNKIAGEDNLDTIKHAPELMERIRRIPVPMLTNPQQIGTGTNIPLCCQTHKVTDNPKPVAVQSTSKGGRFSSPDQYLSQKPQTSTEHNKTTIMTGKDFMSQNRRGSSPASLYQQECCNIAAPQQTSNLQNQTAENSFIASIGETSKLQKSRPPNSIMMQTRMRQPQGPSVSMTQPKSKALSPIRRTSGSPGLTLGSKGGNIPKCCRTTEDTLAEEQGSYSLKQLNDEYDEFIKNWIQQIPIEARGADQTIIDKAKLGMYNGVWKAITKLKMDPATLNHPFYYQDMFDEELEELFNCLPQSPELESKKHPLKAKLIEKTTETNELLVSAAGPSSYKQQLIENVDNHLPKSNIDIVNDEVKLYEELTKINLAENFILYINYREFDRVKATVFKNKLMKEVQELINGIKATHGKELKDIDAPAYMKDIMDGLQKVPLPGEDTIREEANEIYIGIEIDNWFSDLPLVPPVNNVENIANKRHKDVLAKKINDIEKKSNFADCENQIKGVVRRFLEKMPLKPGETDNIGFMTEELVNRLKNRAEDFVAVGGADRKAVAFLDAYDYEDFSREMPVCSSFSDFGHPQGNESSYMIVGGFRVKDMDPAQYAQLRNVTPDSQQQWYSLEEASLPPNWPKDAQEDKLPPCCRIQSGQASMRLAQTSMIPAHTTMPPGHTSMPQAQTSMAPAYTSMPQAQASKPPVRASDSRAYTTIPPPHTYIPPSHTSMPTAQSSYKPPTYSSSSQTRAPHLTIIEPMDPAHSKSYCPDQRQRLEQVTQMPREYSEPGRTRSPERGRPSPQSGPHLSRFDQGPSRTCNEMAPQSQDYEGDIASSDGLERPKSYHTCKLRRSSAPPSYRTEKSTRPAFQSPEFERQQKTTIPSAQFSGEPIGFSTPQNNNHERDRPSSRHKKRMREVERPRREAARKRLDLDDTENESEEEYRCRCMEKVWRCRKRKPMWPSCDDKDFLPCFMGYPRHPCFY